MTDRPRKLLLPILALLLAPLSASAADTGQFLFMNATPAPVPAGETVLINVLAVNSGSEAWEADKTYLLAEIYDKAQRYITATDRLPLTAAVAPGGNVPAQLSFRVPIDFSGDYSFRVFVVHSDQRIVQSDSKSLSVTPQLLPKPGAKPPTRPITLGGNAVFSYRNDTSPNNWSADTSLNLSGRMNEAPFEFNANTLHDQNDSMDVRTVLFNYHARWADVSLGDVSPNFSALSVSGGGMRGGLIKSKVIQLGRVGWVIEAVGARTAEAVEGSATTDGTFRRMLYGTQTSFLLPWALTVRANYNQVEDLQGSVDTPGPTLTPVSNHAAGGGLTWLPIEGMNVDGDYQRSTFEANKNSTGSVTDSAWRVGVGYTQPRWTLTGSVARTGSNFTSLAAPGVAKDRFTYDTSLTLRPWDWLILNNTLSQSRDNLNDDPAKVRSNQRSINSGATLLFPTQTRVTAGYTYNRVFGSPRTTQNNKTAGASLGINQTWKGVGLDLGFQRSEFTDMTNSAHNLLTNTFNSSLNVEMSKQLSATVGEVLSDTYDQKDGSRLRSKTLSISFNGTLDPERLFLRGSVSMADTSDNDAVSPSERQDTNLNLEVTWKASKALGLTVGLFSTNSLDNLTPANSRYTKGVTARVSYSF